MFDGVSNVVSGGVFRCTCCCDVGAGVTCSGVVRCGVVINMYVGVGVLVGILGVRKVLTYSVTYLGEVLGDVPSETWRLKPRLRGSLAQGWLTLKSSCYRRER